MGQSPSSAFHWPRDPGGVPYPLNLFPHLENEDSNLPRFRGLLGEPRKMAFMKAVY